MEKPLLGEHGHLVQVGSLWWLAFLIMTVEIEFENNIPRKLKKLFEQQSYTVFMTIKQLYSKSAKVWPTAHPRRLVRRRRSSDSRVKEFKTAKSTQGVIFMIMALDRGGAAAKICPHRGCCGNAAVAGAKLGHPKHFVDFVLAKHFVLHFLFLLFFLDEHLETWSSWWH